MSRWGKLGFALVAVWAGLSVVSLHVAAQQITGSIRGTVLDPSGAAVAAATVIAKQVETGLTRETAADHSGAFVLVELPIGHYQIEVRAPGFQRYLQQGISLDVNETAAVSIRLKVGSETQQVDVRADAALVQSTVSSLGETVMEHEILDLPLDGRNFSQLGLLQPGVVPLTPGLVQAGGPAREGQAYAVDGQRPESNNFLIDGADNVNAVDAGFVLKPPIDAIAEFKILTHNANAEFGRNTGSTTNIVTRSGSNSFHGAAWEFLRNDAMDSSDYFTHSIQPLKQNQFGATFGGPIVKDKTFFFGYYEGFRNRQGETVPATVPSSNERQGNFGEECTDIPGATFNTTSGLCSNPQGQLTFFGTPVPFNQMTIFTPIDTTVVPSLLPFFPLPNVGANGFIATQTLSQNNDQFGVRLDHYLSGADTLNFRYMYSSGPTTDPLSTAGANVPGFPVGQDDRAQNFVAQETHIFSATTIGVARFSYLRNKFLLDQHVNHTPASDLGFTYQPTLPSAAGPPFIQIGGYASVGDPITGPRNTFQNTFDLSGSLSWIRGRHELKFGGGYRRDQINGLQGIATNGFFVFAGIPSFAHFLYNDGFANFLSGNPVVFLQGGGNFGREIRDRALNAYGQDTYKLTSRLTLNLGLRYELPFPSTENHNQVNLFVPGAQSRVISNAPAGLLYPGDPGVPAGLISTQKTAFAPRVGVAWDPRGDSKTVVSAAYGIFYEPYYTGEGGPLQDPISAPPYLKTLQLGFPIHSFANPFYAPDPFGVPFPEPMTLLVVNRNLHLPYAQDWNLNMQHSFGADWLLQVGYVGTTGVRLPRFIEGNPAAFIPGVDGSGNPLSNENNVNQRRLYSGCTLAQPNNCVYGSVGEIASISNSSYNALEASLRKRFSHGLAFLASYTWSHSIDDVSSFNITGSASQPVAGENDLAQNPFNLAAERGPSMFDARQRFVLSYQWSLPFLQHSGEWYGKVLGNWQLNGIMTAMSGTPFTVFDSNDVSLQGQAPEISGFSSNRPEVVGNPNSGRRSAAEWFNVSAFQKLEPDPQGRFAVFGNEGRNAVVGPRYVNWDFSACKNIRVRESKEIQFRGELFNVLNHTNFRLPVSDIESPTFGQVQSDVSPRVIQVALKFLF
jgi:outer membrane receptor protein involved in Fe transport